MAVYSVAFHVHVYTRHSHVCYTRNPLTLLWFELYSFWDLQAVVTSSLCSLEFLTISINCFTLIHIWFPAVESKLAYVSTSNWSDWARQTKSFPLAICNASCVSTCTASLSISQERSLTISPNLGHRRSAEFVKMNIRPSSSVKN